MTAYAFARPTFRIMSHKLKINSGLILIPRSFESLIKKLASVFDQFNQIRLRSKPSKRRELYGYVLLKDRSASR